MLSIERYLTIEETALELAELTFDENDLLTSMSSLGITNDQFDKIKALKIESQRSAYTNRLNEAINQGEIIVREPGNNLPYAPKVRRDFFEVISVSDLNAWLEKCGVNYRLKDNNQGEPKQSKSKNKEDRNREWQSELVKMANQLIKDGKKSRATKARLAKELAQKIGVDQATIERNTLKTW